MINLEIQTHLWQGYGFSKQTALHDLVQARLKGNVARGNGNKAFKRAAVIETNEWFDHQCRLSEADIDNMASKCAHLWVVVDDSFGHDWAGGGIERSKYIECYHCGTIKAD